MRALLVVSVVLVGLGAAMWNRFAGLLLYLWFSLFRPQEWVWGAIDQLRLSLVIGVAFLIPCLLTGVFPNLTHPTSIASLLLLLNGFVSQFNAIDQAEGWFYLDQLWRVIIVSLLAVTLTTTRKRFYLLLVVIAGSIGLHGAKYGVVFLMRGGARFQSGIGGTFGDNNDFGLAVARVIFLMVAVAVVSSNAWIRRAFWLMAGLSLFCVVGTYSRGAFLALSAGAIVYLVLRRRIATIVAMATLLLGGLYFVPLPQDYIDRLQTIQTYEDVGEASALSRLYFWQVAVRMAADNPLGVGVRNFEENYDRYDDTGGRFGERRSVHSSHFQVLAELGPGGLVMWLSVWGYCLVKLYRLGRLARSGELPEHEREFVLAISIALAASVIAFLVGGSFLAQAFNDLNWVTLALVAVLDRHVARVCVDVVSPSSAAPTVLAHGMRG